MYRTMHIGIDHAALNVFLLTRVLLVVTGGGHISIDHDDVTLYDSWAPFP